jgi:hypothetical protein
VAVGARVSPYVARGGRRGGQEEYNCIVMCTFPYYFTHLLYTTFFLEERASPVPLN